MAHVGVGKDRREIWELEDLDWSGWSIQSFWDKGFARMISNINILRLFKCHFYYKTTKLSRADE